MVLALGPILLGVTACTGEDQVPKIPGDGGSEDAVDARLSRAAMAEGLRLATDRARATEGLSPLEPSDCLAAAAVDRAETLVGQPLEHRPLADVASTCAPGGRVAENLVRSTASPADVVAAWLESPGHRNNLLDPALRVTGVGCARDAGELLCSQLFADGNH